MNIRPIKSDADYEAALKAIDARMDAAPGTAEEAELDVLSTLVDSYEEKHFPIEAPDAISAIEFRMEQAGYSQKDLGVLFSSPSRASEVLRRKRQLSLGMVRLLHRKWKIPAESLIQPYRMAPTARSKGRSRRTA